jgi:hypothetical protein
MPLACTRHGVRVQFDRIIDPRPSKLRKTSVTATQLKARWLESTTVEHR